MRDTTSTNGSDEPGETFAALARASRAHRRLLALHDATPELLEAEPDTVIALSAVQAAELAAIEAATGTSALHDEG